MARSHGTPPPTIGQIDRETLVKTLPSHTTCMGGKYSEAVFRNLRCGYCLPRGRNSEAAHEKRLLCAQKCTRGGVGWGGVGHVGVGWGGSLWSKWVKIIDVTPT